MTIPPPPHYLMVWIHHLSVTIKLKLEQCFSVGLFIILHNVFLTKEVKKVKLLFFPLELAQ